MFLKKIRNQVCLWSVTAAVEFQLLCGLLGAGGGCYAYEYALRAIFKKPTFAGPYFENKNKKNISCTSSIHRKKKSKATKLKHVVEH